MQATELEPLYGLDGWQGEITQEPEITLIKTQSGLRAEIEQAVNFG